MCQSIQDLALSMDPNIKIKPGVEDVRQLLSSILTPHAFRLHPPQLLLNIVVGFIDSVTNFGCRHAKHCRGDIFILVRGSSSLSTIMHHGLHTADAERITIFVFLVLHRTRRLSITLSQAGTVPTTQSAQSAKKGAQGMQNSL